MDEGTLLWHLEGPISLTNLLFTKRPFCSNHFELRKLLCVGRKQHLVHNSETVQITVSEVFSFSDITVISQGLYCHFFLAMSDLKLEWRMSTSKAKISVRV